MIEIKHSLYMLLIIHSLYLAILIIFEFFLFYSSFLGDVKMLNYYWGMLTF